MRGLAFLLLFSIGDATCALAQSTYERIFVSTAAYKMKLIELPSGNVLMAAAWYPGISLLSTEGWVMHSKCFYGDSVLTMGSIGYVAENEFYFSTHYRKDSCSSLGTITIPYTHAAVGRMDSLGNVLALRYYAMDQSECVNTTSDLEVISDKRVVVWGRDSKFFAMCIDSTLEPIWAKQCTQAGGFQFIKELPGGDLLAGINLETAGAVVARMNANGDFLWVKSYIRPKGMIHDVLIESDDSFVITGYTDSTSQNMFTPLPASFQPKLFMMKLGGGGEVQWCRGYYSTPNLWHTPEASRIERTHDGRYAVLATLGYPQNNFHYRPFLMKTDVNGDTIWTRSVGRINYDHYATDLLVYSDGGYMISGGIQGDLPGGNSGLPFVFKTDSLGHVPCWERVTTVHVQDLFPVDSIVTLSVVHGATGHPAFANDTVFDPLVVYDGCTFTAGMPVNVSRSRKVTVRPNPSTGRFILEVSDPLMAESYCSVYDALGKLLYERPLPTGSTMEEIDLSRFGRGTYVLRITDPEGQRHERVVLE